METKTEKRISRADALKHARQLEQQFRAVQRALGTKDTLTLQLFKVEEDLGKYTFNQIWNKKVRSRCVIGLGPDGQPKILQEFFVTPHEIEKTRLPPEMNKSLLPKVGSERRHRSER